MKAPLVSPDLETMGPFLHGENSVVFFCKANDRRRRKKIPCKKAPLFSDLETSGGGGLLISRFSHPTGFTY